MAVAGCLLSACGSSSGGGSADAIAKTAMVEMNALGMGLCDKLDNPKYTVVEEGTMKGPLEGFNGRTLPAAVIKASATCVRNSSGDKREFNYWLIAAYDKEFSYVRGTAWTAGMNGDMGPRKSGFEEQKRDYFTKK